MSVSGVEVEVDDRVAEIWRGGSIQGLVIGQRLGRRVFAVRVVELPRDADTGGTQQTEAFGEAVQRLLCGALSLLGTLGGEVGLLWTLLGHSGHNLPILHFSSGMALHLHRSGASWSSLGQPVAWKNAGNICSRMSLHTAQLPIRLGLCVSPSTQSVGAALEAAAQQLASKIRSDVVVGSFRDTTTNRMKLDEVTPLFTHKAGELVVSYVEEGSNLVISDSVVAGWIFIHPDCSDEDAAQFMVDDLARSVTTRVQVLLDELEIMQEESAEPATEHPLSRYGTGKGLVAGMKWMLPRRVLVRASKAAMPGSDWQMPHEYDGKATVARWKSVFGLSKLTPQVIDSRLEPASEVEVPLTLQGGLDRTAQVSAKAAVGVMEAAPRQKDENDARRMLLTGLGACMVVILAVLLAHLMRH